MFQYSSPQTDLKEVGDIDEQSQTFSAFVQILLMALRVPRAVHFSSTLCWQIRLKDVKDVFMFVPSYSSIFPPTPTHRCLAALVGLTTRRGPLCVRSAIGSDDVFDDVAAVMLDDYGDAEATE